MPAQTGFHVTRRPTLVRVPRRLRLTAWWRRLWLSREARDLLDEHARELDRALLYGTRGSRGR